MEVEDLKDFADAIEKVVSALPTLRDAAATLYSDEIYDAVRAIDENVGD